MKKRIVAKILKLSLKKSIYKSRVEDIVTKGQTTVLSAQSFQDGDRGEWKVLIEGLA